MESYKVYAHTDSSGRIEEINSDSFLADVAGWVQIDEGNGDRYHHAQNNYLPLPLVTEQGVCRYKLVDGKPAERTAEEMAGDAPHVVDKPTTEARLEALEGAMLAVLTMGVSADV